jgi:hypothetical protein
MFLRVQGFFVWTYKDVKGIPPKLVDHRIGLDTIIPPAHQYGYRLNPNYVVVVKEDIDKLLAMGFIQPMEKATCTITKPCLFHPLFSDYND